MIDTHNCGQVDLYYLLKEIYLNNKLSHAYLIDTNNTEMAFKGIISFVKYLICPYHIEKDCNNTECSICKRIDDNCFSELKIINSNGLWIKKEQLMELKNEFNKKGIESLKRIYIINEADKLNDSSANTILNFLEEPDCDIIAFLITDKINKILPTIKSRCQYITKYFDNDVILYDVSVVNNVLEFISFLESSSAIINEKKYWIEIFKEREENYIALCVLLSFYEEVLRVKIGKKNIKFCENIELIEKISVSNTLDRLLFKLQTIIECKNNIRKNVNISLLVDNLIINFGGD